jgi:hypothetical protein
MMISKRMACIAAATLLGLSACMVDRGRETSDGYGRDNGHVVDQRDHSRDHGAKQCEGADDHDCADRAH